MPPAKRKAAAKAREAAKKQAACAEDPVPHRDASGEPEDHALSVPRLDHVDDAAERFDVAGFGEILAVTTFLTGALIALGTAFSL